MKSYYSDLIPTLAERSKNGVLSSLGFSSLPLRKFLIDKLSNPYGVDGSLIGDPAFEAVFGWKTSDKQIKNLAGNLLQEKLVDALHNGDKEHSLKETIYPYTHQMQAWHTLLQEEPQSAIISSGTGSGKTECFMIPILNRLVEEHEQTKQRLKGVRAIFLYPLNALINSQRERLRTWTEPFEGNIRFCLYNGLTPEKAKQFDRNKTPNEVIDREELRNSPPPILVTNPTMLEYMLVRAKDNPIVEQSRGKLDTIVLDEAHSYIGSQAAEITLLIRRVLQAFGKHPSDVRFIATSATIGDNEQQDAEQQLQEFLSEIAGIPPENVHVMQGNRNIPELQISKDNNFSLHDLKEVETNIERYKSLQSNKTSRQIRALFTKSPHSVAKLSDVCELLFGKSSNYSKQQQKQALDWLDLLSSAEDEKGKPFLPLRSHIFERTLPGLWACCDSNCSIIHDTPLQSEEWPFGMVYLEKRTECECGSPVYEIVSCKECGTVYLEAEIDDSENRIIQPNRDEEIDEFQLEVEEDSDAEEQNENTMHNRSQSKVLISNRSDEKTESVYIDKSTSKILSSENGNGIQIFAIEDDSGQMDIPCPNCNDSSRKSNGRYRSHRVGAPYFLNVTLPTLLNYAEEKNESPNLPYNGRRLLTFNDSRQGTARIAAKLQQDAERSKARGLI